jgi:hypothetical protein
MTTTNFDLRPTTLRYADVDDDDDEGILVAHNSDGCGGSITTTNTNNATIGTRGDNNNSRSSSLKTSNNNIIVMCQTAMEYWNNHVDDGAKVVAGGIGLLLFLVLATLVFLVYVVTGMSQWIDTGFENVQTTMLNKFDHLESRSVPSFVCNDGNGDDGQGYCYHSSVFSSLLHGDGYGYGGGRRPFRSWSVYYDGDASLYSTGGSFWRWTAFIALCCIVLLSMIRSGVNINTLSDILENLKSYIGINNNHNGNQAPHGPSSPPRPSVAAVPLVYTTPSNTTVDNKKYHPASQKIRHTHSTLTPPRSSSTRPGSSSKTKEKESREEMIKRVEKQMAEEYARSKAPCEPSPTKSANNSLKSLTKKERIAKARANGRAFHETLVAQSKDL